MPLKKNKRKKQTKLQRSPLKKPDEKMATSCLNGNRRVFEGNGSHIDNSYRLMDQQFFDGSKKAVVHDSWESTVKIEPNINCPSAAEGTIPPVEVQARGNFVGALSTMTNPPFQLKSERLSDNEDTIGMDTAEIEIVFDSTDPNYISQGNNRIDCFTINDEPMENAGGVLKNSLSSHQSLHTSEARKNFDIDEKPAIPFVFAEDNMSFQDSTLPPDMSEFPNYLLNQRQNSLTNLLDNNTSTSVFNPCASENLSSDSGLLKEVRIKKERLDAREQEEMNACQGLGETSTVLPNHELESSPGILQKITNGDTAQALNIASANVLTEENSDKKPDISDNHVFNNVCKENVPLTENAFENITEITIKKEFNTDDQPDSFHKNTVDNALCQSSHLSISPDAIVSADESCTLRIASVCSEAVPHSTVQIKQESPDYQCNEPPKSLSSGQASSLTTCVPNRVSEDSVSSQVISDTSSSMPVTEFPSPALSVKQEVVEDSNHTNLPETVIAKTNIPDDSGAPVKNEREVNASSAKIDHSPNFHGVLHSMERKSLDIPVNEQKPFRDTTISPQHLQQTCEESNETHDSLGKYKEYLQILGNNWFNITCFTDIEDVFVEEQNDTASIQQCMYNSTEQILKPSMEELMFYMSMNCDSPDDKKFKEFIEKLQEAELVEPVVNYEIPLPKELISKSSDEPQNMDIISEQTEPNIQHNDELQNIANSTIKPAPSSLPSNGTNSASSYVDALHLSLENLRSIVDTAKSQMPPLAQAADSTSSQNQCSRLIDSDNSITHSNNNVRSDALQDSNAKSHSMELLSNATLKNILDTTSRQSPSLENSPLKASVNSANPKPNFSKDDNFGEESGSDMDVDNTVAYHEESDDSTETLKNVASCKKQDAGNSSDGESHVTSEDESPKIKKSRYEQIMERKEKLESSTKVSVKHSDSVNQIKDPRLANVCQRLKPVSKKVIPVIQPLPIENLSNKKSKASAKDNKKSNSSEESPKKSLSAVKKIREKEFNDDDPSRERVKRLKKSKHDDCRMMQHQNSGQNLGKGERFASRSSFLTENSARRPSDKKQRPLPKPDKAPIPRKRQLVNMEELHSNIDLPNDLHSQLDSNIRQPKQSASAYECLNSRYSSNAFSGYSAQIGSSKDPRLNRGVLPQKPPEPVNSSIWPQHHANHSAFSMNARSGHDMSVSTSQLQSAYTEWNTSMQCPAPDRFIYMHSQPVHTLAPHQRQSEPDLSPQFTPPLPAYEPVQPPLPLTGPFPDSPSSSLQNLAFLPNNQPRLLQSSIRSSRTDVSLLPGHLKDAVGVKILSSTEFLIIMLTWNVEWLSEQSKCSEPPPICSRIAPVQDIYLSFDHYFNTYLPLLLIETWQRLHTEWKQVVKRRSQGHRFIIDKMKPTGDMMEIQCSLKANKDHPYPYEGQIVMLKFSSHQESIKIFGYVSHHVYTSGNFNSLNFLPIEESQELHLYIKAIYRLQGTFSRQQVLIIPIYSLKSTLSQIRALRCVELSALCQSLMSPHKQDCDLVRLERIKTTCPESLSGAVSLILNSIQLTNDKPHMTIVDFHYGMDQLAILEALVDQVHSLKLNGSNGRILICTRSINRLREVGARFIPSDSDTADRLRTVILARADIISYPDLKKLTLEEIISSQERCDNEPVWSSLERGNNAKINVLKSSDVLLSIITTCDENNIQNVLHSSSEVPIRLCIIDEARLCTEPETLVPLQYGITKFILFSDERVKPSIRTKLAKEYGLKLSLVARLMKKLV